MIKVKYVLPVALVAGSLFAGSMAMADEPAPPPHGAMAQTHMKRPATMSDADRVEHRITSLHDMLKITPAEEDQWKPVADVMRENAKTLRELHEAKMAKVDTQTAIDDLASYREIAEAHYQAAKRMEETFGTFYATLSPDQKKLADTVFREHKHNMERGEHHKERHE